MNQICRDTNRCWAYPGRSDVFPTPGCGERCGGHARRKEAISSHYRQIVDDFHDRNPFVKRLRKFIEEGV